MKRWIQYHSLLILLLISTIGVTQTAGLRWNNLDESSNRLQGKITGETYYITPFANNNYFLNKEWLYADVFLEDGDAFDSLRVRYLAYGDELVAYNEKLKILFTIDKEIIRSFTINDPLKTRNFIKLYFDGIIKGDRFYELLYKGNRSLIAFHHVDEVKVNPYINTAGIMLDTEFRLNITYFMYSGESGFIKLQNRKRSFQKALPEYKKEIRKLFRQNKLVIRDENSMIQAFDLINSAGLLE